MSFSFKTEKQIKKGVNRKAQIIILVSLILI